MKKQLFIIFLALIISIGPAQGMKRASAEMPSEQLASSVFSFPADVWTHILSYCSWFELGDFAATGKIYKNLVRWFVIQNSVNPLSIDIITRQKELLAALKTLDFCRMYRAKSTLPDDTFKLYPRYKTAIFKFMIETYSDPKRCTVNDKTKLNEFTKKIFPAGLLDLGPEFHKKLEAQSQGPIAMETRWHNLMHALDTEQKNEFIYNLQATLYSHIIADDEYMVKNLLATQLFSSHFDQTTCPFSCKDYDGLLTESLDYAGPSIHSSLMTWIFSSKLSDHEKSNLYVAHVFYLILYNKPEHLHALLQIPKGAADRNKLQSVLFYLALLQENYKCAQVLISNKVCPQELVADGIVTEFMNGTLFTNPVSIDTFFTRMVFLLKDNPYIEQAMTNANLNLYYEFANARAFAKVFCPQIIRRIQTGKALNASDHSFIILLCYSLPSILSDSDSKIVHTLFSSNLETFKTVFAWPHGIPKESTFIGSQSAHLCSRITLLQQLLTKSLISGKYTYTQALLNENWILDPLLACAVFSHYTKDMVPDKPYKKFLVLTLPDDAHNIELIQGRLLEKVSHAPQEITQQLMLCCLFNSVSNFTTIDTDPMITFQIPPAAQEALIRKIYEWKPSLEQVEDFLKGKATAGNEQGGFYLPETILIALQDYVRSKRNGLI